jgi:ketosteroid isomerase-like protein
MARRGIEAYNAGDVAGMLSTLSEDIEVFASQEMANAGHYQGHDGFLQWIREWNDAWDETSVEPTETAAIGDRHVVVAVHQKGRGRSGIEVSMDLAFLFEVQDDGICTFLAMLPDRGQAVALGREREDHS